MGLGCFGKTPHTGSRASRYPKGPLAQEFVFVRDPGHVWKRAGLQKVNNLPPNILLCCASGLGWGRAQQRASAKEPGRGSMVPIAEDPAGSGELQTEAAGPSRYHTRWPQSLGILFTFHSSLLSFQTLTCFSCIVQLPSHSSICRPCSLKSGHTVPLVPSF